METMRNGISYQVVEQAQEGNANMQYQLASYLYTGDDSKEPNKEQGYRWMTAAAENGSVKAQKVLGLLFTSGQHSPWPAQDLGQAVYWYERAARAGDAEAMYWMYRCYDQGVGVAKDKEAARYWLAQAADRGYEVDEAELAKLMPQPEPEKEDQKEKPWEQYDLEEKPSERPSRHRGRGSRTSRDLRKKSLDMAQDGILFIPKHDMAYVRSALSDGIVVLSGAVIFFCILALVIHAANRSFFASAKGGAFVVFAVLISVGACAFVFRRAYLKAYDETRKSAWFRNTAFYKQYGVDYEDLSQAAAMQYEYYAALEKSFHPLAYSDVLPRELFRDVRGLMFMGLFFGERGACAVPDFVIVTEKAVYVIQCVKASGTLIGDIRDEGWELLLPSGRSHMIGNPVRQNEQRLRILEKDLNRICPWAVTAALSMHSIVVIGTDVDTHELTGNWRSENSHLLQVSPEELRSQIEVLESKNTLHEEEAHEVAKAMEQIAQEYEQRADSFGREMM